MTESTDFDIADLRRRMHGAVSALKSEFSGLRTGRASASLLDPIVVEAYGTKMPLNQIASVSVPEARLLSVQVWDQTHTGAVDKAIRNSELGLNPIVEGQVLRIPIPELNEERRLELVRVAGKYAEQARIAVRNVRRDGMDTLKRLEKSGDIGKDEQKAWSDEVQSLTNETVSEIDAMFSAKEGEIKQV